MELLIVDDDYAVRAAVRRALALEGYEVSMASSGEEAIELLGEGRWDAVILDILMGGLSGLEVCRRLRAAGDRTPILMLTARETIKDRVAGLETGADDYLVKPFGRERLAAATERVRARLGHGETEATAADRMRSALDPGPLVRLFARRGDRIVPIAVAGIRRIQARGDYAEVHAAEGEFLLRLALTDLVPRLDPRHFLQVHRSHVVNLDAIDHLRPYDDRRLAITLKDGSVVVASRTASEELRRLVR